MARVNIEGQAYLDSRFARLASLLGLADADHAIGKMGRVWLECTLRETEALLPAELGFAFGGSFSADGEKVSASVVESGLGEFLGDGRIRIRGCENRTDWLSKKRKAAKKGGKASAKAREAKYGSASPSASKHSHELPPKHATNPPAPAPAPALARSNTLSQLAAASPTADRAGKKINGHKSRSRQAGSEPPSESFELADYLRRQILKAKPDHRLGRRAWTASDSQRSKWALELARMVRLDGRSWRRSAELIAWVSRGCPGTDIEFVVESPKALRDKWDRIDSAQRKAKPSQGAGEPERRRTPEEMLPGMEILR